uniref:Calcium-transporting ATPase n=1 Tax=Ditylenchus dipsaci TaxID=166011 RepID=A0A915CWQ2_9BILA
MSEPFRDGHNDTRIYLKYPPRKAVNLIITLAKHSQQVNQTSIFQNLKKPKGSTISRHPLIGMPIGLTDKAIDSIIDHNGNGKDKPENPLDTLQWTNNDNNNNIDLEKAGHVKRQNTTTSNEATWPSLLELRKLMETRGAEAVVKLNDNYNGADGLCRKMDVDPNAFFSKLVKCISRGLSKSEAELSKRRAKYGANTIPKGKSKSFVRLVLDACRDPTLIILIVAGFISLALSFYEPSPSKPVPHNNSTSFAAVNASGVFARSNTTLVPLPQALALNTTEAVPEEEEEIQHEDHGSAWIEGVAILICVVVVVLVTAINDFSKERQFRNLQAKIETGHKFSVIRDGEAFDVPVSDLVAGDVVRVKYGDLIPADGVLLASSDLKIDESSLTGESDHVKKSVEGDPILLSGTYAMEGSAKMVITAVGVNSQTGIIMTLLNGGKVEGEPTDTGSSSSSSSDSTSSGSGSSSGCSVDEEDTLHAKSILQTKLSSLALQIIYCGTTVAIVALVVLVVRYCIEEYLDSGNFFNIEHLHNFVKFFIIAVTILVISIPEGLPLAIALSLTYSVKKMMKDNNLVRHLDACETMGNATTICSDKTGTLTTNRMTVVQSYICGQYYKDEKSQPNGAQLPGNTTALLSEALSINCAYNSMVVEPQKSGERVQQLGNKTESSRGEFDQSVHIQFFPQVYDDSHPTFQPATYQNRLPCVLQRASEILLSKCDFIIGQDGQAEPFTEEERTKIMKEVIHNGMAQNGLRTICVAYKDYIYSSVRPALNTEITIAGEGGEVDWNDEEEVASKLVAVAICGIQDPVRDEVPAAIEQCRRAGITVRMVTGDNVNTARAIAIQCRILEPGDDFLVLEGREFNERIRDETGKISQTKLDEIWPRLRVLARAQPADKFTLVKGIIDSKNTTQREIVAVTGDGTNDGPALKKADVGFAMGIAGTDVAKEASTLVDIILTDDNFSSIVKAVMWGRNVYDSISKFLQFQLTVNIVAVLTAFIGACTIADSPLKAVHMLWINLIMDTLASLALATETPTDELLQRKPYGRKKSLISRTMIKNILCHAFYH